jgi:hypothetical protein
MVVKLSLMPHPALSNGEGSFISPLLLFLKVLSFGEDLGDAASNATPSAFHLPAAKYYYQITNQPAFAARC